ncbi:DUF551 domain-containing protein [Salmonella enterica subsp. enterica serovar Infantis]|nr:DUF551 domain-containing protein [Salmonella enterica subsp. enterica serovar Infantis]EBZ6694957.1 DUF551 domain-containing protein [Salmonella enterica subsp. enterica serovar Enteritidis]EBY5257028.1 DUF551 domain-containing protein [Salmonella enterica subsp. enterica serovar Infantis]EBZ4806343.1 DUF551 domain-containing protein [Salmonella enterica subsp. enterica serovar Infantis]EBZ6804884.1 DUF551 domain-containing protein [Salmonella enterica subsp. enterica serovar Infantis]
MKELEFAITQSAFTSIRDGLNDELELARIALAALEAAPEPVVPESISVRQAISALESADCVTTIGQAYKMGWNACRAAMLQGSQPVSNRDELQVIGWLRSDYNSDDKRDPDAPLFMLGSNNPSETWGVKYMPLTGNSPVTPDGWISCSERMPDDGQHVIILCDGAFVLYAQYRDGEFFDVVRNGEEFFETHSRNVTDWMPLPEPPQEEK